MYASIYNVCTCISAEASFDHCQFNNQSADDPADLSQAKLRECQFKHCNLSVVDLVRCSAYDVQFLHCQMQGSDLSKSDFCLPVGDARLAAMTMQQCNFSFGNLSQCYLNNCEISDSRLLEACFDYTDLSEATLTNNNLHNLVATGLEIWGADLSGSEFNNLNPQHINLDQVTMTPEQLTMLADCVGIVVNFD